MRVIAVVQARLDSRRYPRKVLADLAGRPVLAHVLERALAIRSVDLVVVSLPAADEPDIREALVQANVAPAVAFVSLQQPPDLLGAYAYVAWRHEADIVVRITADCPLLCPYTAAAVVRHVRDGVTDFASNDTTRSGYPDGTDVEAFTAALLKRAADNATDPADLEHVTPWMRRHIGAAAVVERWTPAAMSLKISIDLPSDLERVRRIYAAIDPPSFHISSTLAAARKVGEWR